MLQMKTGGWIMPRNTTILLIYHRQNHLQNVIRVLSVILGVFQLSLLEVNLISLSGVKGERVMLSSDYWTR
jgi:hypothetical protein